jgi:predicted transcriptional regulator
VARKFSLKDNPIFQRLEIPKPLEAGVKTLHEGPFDHIDETNVSHSPPEEESTEQRGEFRPSRIERQTISSNEPLPSGLESDVFKNRADQNIGISTDQGNVSILSAEKFEGHELTLKNLPSSEKERLEHVSSDPRTRSSTDIKAPASAREVVNNSFKEDDSLNRNNKGSKFEAQNLRLKFNSPETNKSVDSSELVEGIDKSLFFSFYNEMNDDLLPQFDPAEQILYSRLFRLSYGFNRNYCTVSQPVLRDKTGLSRNTIRTGLQTLVKKEWLRIIDAGNHVSTTYRVILLRERNGRSLFDGQKLSFKKRRSKNDPQKLRRKNRSSETDLQDAQKRDLQNLTPKEEKSEIDNKIEQLLDQGSNFEAQKSGTITITNSILTLSQSKIENPDPDNTKYDHSADLLITHFYTKLAQEPSSAKRAKNLGDCIQLLRDGFSPEQIEYGINWLLSRYPETGSFSRVVHFIDQALKEREVEQQAAMAQQKRRLSREDEYHSVKRSNEEAKQIEAIKTSLTTELLTALRDEAARLVDSEHGVPKYGRETLVLIKLNELIRLRFLTSDTE